MTRFQRCFRPSCRRRWVAAGSWVAALALAAVVSGCSRVIKFAGGPESDLALIDPDSSSVTVRIDNRHWSNVVVYLAHDGVRTRLGMIRTAEVVDYPIPTRWTGSSRNLQLVAHAVGGASSFTSETFYLDRGQTVTWQLESNLNRSNLMIR
ncbi:MAG: hypothetical protein KGL93_04265 [Gemmatimonadota bacterium]|nr:hypothetical protein [Gemmatimonadota bacterium]